MNQDTLNSLKPGEKVADIQEYFWGKNGQRLVFKVTIYSCIYKSILGIFKKRVIDTFEFPFYFVSKEFAQKYLEDYDNFEIFKTNFKRDNFKRDNNGYLYLDADITYVLQPKNIEKPRNFYYMVDAYNTMECPCSKSNRLLNGGIWGGTVNTDFNGEYVEKSSNFSYNCIYEVEKYASKEGTTGKTYSFKLTEV